MKYCPYCGAGLDDGFAFCPKCGKPFEGEKENPHLVEKSAPQESGANTAPAPAAEAAPKKKKTGLFVLIAVVVVLAIVGGLFASRAVATKSFTDNAHAIAQASHSVVMLTCYDKDGEQYSTGSGFAAFDDGVIVTNYHVIEQEVCRIKAQTEGGISFECPTVLAYDADKDIAILRADRKTDLALLPVGTANYLQKGAKVVAIGSPLGLINSVSTGVFSGYMEDKAGSVLQFTAAISHGSSGGVLFNDAGEVIGITFASLTEGQSLNLAVPIDDAKALYEKTGNDKQMSIEEFYGTFNHIQTYSVGYVLKHFNDLDRGKMYVEGYVSSVAPFGRFYLVDSPSAVLGYTITAEEAVNGKIRIDRFKEEEERAKDYKCLCFNIPLGELELKPNDKVSILCELDIWVPSANGKDYIRGDKLHFTGYEVSIIG